MCIIDPELIDVDLEEDGVGELGGHRLERRLDRPARPAPWRREVDHHLNRQIVQETEKRNTKSMKD